MVCSRQIQCSVLVPETYVETIEEIEMCVYAHADFRPYTDAWRAALGAHEFSTGAAKEET